MRDRLIELQKYGEKERSRILEIGPFFNPIFPKSAGFNTKVLDVFSKDELLNIADGIVRQPGYSGSLNLSAKQIAAIEDVDYIWKGDLKSSIVDDGFEPFDLICSSHNFEHQPNPLKFLQDVEYLLSDEGVCTMAIPISTRCFDLLRFPSSTRDFVEKFERGLTRPGLSDYLDTILCSVNTSSGDLHRHKSISQRTINLIPPINGYDDETIKKSRLALSGQYVDTHVSILNPKIFTLVLVDLLVLGFLDKLKIFDISEFGIEFFVHLSKHRLPIFDYNLDRKQLCVAAADYWATDIKNALSSDLSLFGNKKLLNYLPADL